MQMPMWPYSLTLGIIAYVAILVSARDHMTTGDMDEMHKNMGDMGGPSWACLTKAAPTRTNGDAFSTQKCKPTSILCICMLLVLWSSANLSAQKQLPEI